MAEGATDLSELLGSAPIQNATLPQSTTFSPIVTGGVDPFISPQPSGNPPPAMRHDATFSMVKYTMKSLMTYFGFFVAAMVISLSTPRSIMLQYIPNTYIAGGIVSYQGAGILALIAVAISYILGTLGSALI